MPKTSKIQLEKRERRFAKQVVLHKFRGDKAAIAAGYSEKSAKQIASRMLTRASVQQYIAEEIERANAKLDIEQEELLRGAHAAATLDPTEIIEVNGDSVTVKDLTKVPVELRRTIEEIAPTKFGVRLKFESKASARDFIAKVKGWYKEQPYIGGAVLIFKNAGGQGDR